MYMSIDIPIVSIVNSIKSALILFIVLHLIDIVSVGTIESHH